MSPTNEWDQVAATWDANDSTLAYATAAFDSLRSVLELHEMNLAGSHVCDFGCGTGLLTEKLLDGGATVDAIDNSTAMLEILRQKAAANGWDRLHTATALPAHDGAVDYDIVVCSSVCAFLPDYPAHVQDMARRLRAGGVFVQWDWELADEAGGTGLTRSEVRDALVGAGLSSVAVETAFEITIEGHTMRPLVGYGLKG